MVKPLYRAVQWTAISTVLLLLLSPLLLYCVGLKNIDGRPGKPSVSTVQQKEASAVWSMLKESGMVKVTPLNPYLYLKSLIGDRPLPPGAKVAWYVARDYNNRNLKHKRGIWWHVSGAALTIWLTRNWDADELIAKAAEIAKGRESGVRENQGLRARPLVYYHDSVNGLPTQTYS